MKENKIKIETHCTPDLMAMIAAVRTKAWNESSLSIYANPPVDYLDKHSVHFVAYERDAIVASARVSILKKDMIGLLPDEVAALFDLSQSPILLSRLVTAPEARHRGLAYRLIAERLAYVSDSKDIFAYVRSSAAKYYVAFGFKIIKKTHQPFLNSCLISLIK